MFHSLLTIADGGQDVFLAIGDSNSAGKGATTGPTLSAGILQNWNGSSLDDVTTGDISTNPGGPYGTMYKQFALDYNANTGRKVVMVAKGSSGASFYPSGDDNNWYTSGDLYSDAVTEANNCLAHVGVSSLKGIILWCGINDARRGQSLDNINSAISSLISRLASDFPNVPVLIAQVGVQEVAGLLNEARQYAVRRYLKAAVLNNSQCHFFSHPACMWKIGAAGDYYNTDNLHMEQDGLNIMGAQLARWFKYSSYSKEARMCIAASMGEMSSGQRTALATFIDAQVTAVNFYKIEQLTFFKTFTRDNIYMDYGFLWGTTDNIAQPTFTANQDTYFDGVDDTFVGYVPSSGDGGGFTLSDFIVGASMSDNDSANPSTAALFGRQTTSGGGNPLLLVRQNSSGNISYYAGDATASLAPVARFANDTIYSVARNGGTKYFLIDGAVSASASVSLLGGTQSAPYIANFRLVSTSNQLMTGGYTCFYMAKYSNFDVTAFITALKTYLAAI